MRKSFRLRISPLVFIGAFISGLMHGCAAAKWSEFTPTLSNNTSGVPVNSPQLQTTTETFVQDDAANKVDILIINDNSASMDPEQRKMSARFSSFISELKGIDYHISMTTTDVDSPKWNQDGRILPWNGAGTRVLTPSTPNAAAVFQATVARPETIGCHSRNDCPSSNEQPLRALERAMDQHLGANANFFRDSVDLVAVVLSDEDEMSDGPAKATLASDVTAHFKSVFGATKRFAVHGLIIEPGDSKCLNAQAAQPDAMKQAFYGRRVAELASLTGGTINSICDTDYAKDLQTISSEVRRLISTFELSAAPIAGTVNVVTTPNFKTAWTTEGSKLIFDPAPPAGARIEVTYKH